MQPHDDWTPAAELAMDLWDRADAINCSLEEGRDPLDFSELAGDKRIVLMELRAAKSHLCDAIEKIKVEIQTADLRARRRAELEQAVDTSGEETYERPPGRSLNLNQARNLLAKRRDDPLVGPAPAHRAALWLRNPSSDI